MINVEQIEQVEFSVEAALRGVAHLRDYPTPGNVEVIVGNLYRAIHEVQALNVEPHASFVASAAG